MEGGQETAKLKLASAGFDIDKLIIASTSDHHQRIEIMKRAQQLVDVTSRVPVTYFSDAEWDLKACQYLDFNLVIIGDWVQYHQQLNDFACIDTAFEFIK